MILSPRHTPRYFDHIFAYCKRDRNWNGDPLYGKVDDSDHYEDGFTLDAGFADGGMPGIFWSKFNVIFSSRRVQR